MRQAGTHASGFPVPLRCKISSLFNVTTDYLLGKPEMKKETDIDLDNALDNAVAYNGKPISDDDRAMAKSLLQAYFGNKK